MILGPTSVYKCPKCGNLFKNSSVKSSFSMGGFLYSDGQLIESMAPKSLTLTKCQKCNTYLWLNKLEDINTKKWQHPIKPEWRKADFAKFLTIEENFDALKQGIAENKDEEKYIRKQIWWEYNDRKSENQKMFIDENDELMWRENCIALSKLLNFNDTNQRIMIAEINRNLGNFDKCIDIINTIDDTEINWVKEKYITECKKKNKWVILLNNPMESFPTRTNSPEVESPEPDTDDILSKDDTHTQEKPIKLPKLDIGRLMD